MIKLPQFCTFFVIHETGIMFGDFFPQNKLVDLKYKNNYFISLHNIVIYKKVLTIIIINNLIFLWSFKNCL